MASSRISLAQGVLARSELTMRKGRESNNNGWAHGADDHEDVGSLSPSALMGARQAPSSLNRLVNALRAPELESHRELLEDLFELAILDVRKFESDILEENQALKRQLAELQDERRGVKEQLRAVATRQIRVGKREARVQKEEAKLRSLKKSLEAREANMKRSSSRVIPPLPQTDELDQIRSGAIHYMMDCENLLGNPRTAIRARTGVNESSSTEKLQSAMTQHFMAIEDAFDKLIRNYRDQLKTMVAEKNAAESKESENGSVRSSNMAAASRIRERKALREKDILLQAMKTVENIAKGLAQDPAFQGRAELDMIQSLAKSATGTQSPML